MTTSSVQRELDRAQQALRAAALLHEQGLFADAVSRSYYAILHAARAALLSHEVIAESHAGLRRLFGSTLVHPGLLEAKWARILATAQDRRAAADYNSQLQWDDAASRQLLDDARSFVARIEGYLRPATPPQS